jgi:hypothetical protein
MTWWRCPSELPGFFCLIQKPRTPSGVRGFFLGCGDFQEIELKNKKAAETAAFC